VDDDSGVCIVTALESIHYNHMYRVHPDVVSQTHRALLHGHFLCHINLCGTHGYISLVITWRTMPSVLCYVLPLQPMFTLFSSQSPLLSKSWFLVVVRHEQNPDVGNSFAISDFILD
jgi:hypothetical protein